MIREYFPGTERPPQPDYYYFTPRDFAEAFVMMKDKHRPKDVRTSFKLKKNNDEAVDFSLNVVQFIRKNDSENGRSAGNFSQLTQLCKGQYQTVTGMEEIQSYVK